MAINTDYDDRYEVCIAGGGPVGTYLAARLARAGVKVAVFEALTIVPEGGRAISHTPVLFKEFESAGILERMKQVSDVHDAGIDFRRTKDLQVMDRFQPEAGMPGPLILPQWKFTKLLIEETERFPNAKILFGHKVIRIEDSGAAVSLEVQDTDADSVHRYICKYFVGADGSKSVVRAALGTTYVGETLPFKLLAADVVFPFEDHHFGPANFMLDTEDFGLLGLITRTKKGESIWRVSTGFPINMSDEDIMEALPAKLQRLFSELKPGSYRILAAEPYKAHQLSTTTMRNGRLLIVGDAAHLANPFSGQSLATGILDASSLAQCLIPIIQGNAADTLLDEWSEDRLSKFKKILDPVSRACFAAVRHADFETIGQRHPLLKAMRAGPGKGGPPPSLYTDVTTLKSWVSSGVGKIERGDDKSSIWVRT